MKDKISVIVPCYNVHAYIERCLKSIEGQTYGIENLEIILVDDASTDDTLVLLQKFEQKYPENVLLVVCKENAKQGAARNLGLEYSTGEYVTFVDADDVIDITMLQKMYDIIKEYDCDIVDCGYKVFSQDEEIILEENNKGVCVRIDTVEKRRQYIIQLTKLAVWGRLYKKSFIEENSLRFLEGTYYEDVHFTGLLKLLVNSYYCMEEKLYYYFQNDCGTMLNRVGVEERIKQELWVMDALFEEWDARGLLQNALEQYYHEIELYRIVNSFGSPILYLSQNAAEVTGELLLFFKNGLLEVFPQAYNNPYIPSVYPNVWQILTALMGKPQEK